jgi:PAS domain S-box-containing protein
MQYPNVVNEALRGSQPCSNLSSLDNGAFSFSHKTLEKDFELLTRALNASISGIVLTDNEQPDNPIIYCNAAFEEITGYNRKEIIGRNCRFLQAKDRDQEERALIRNSITEGKSCLVEITNYKKDGTLFWNELSLSPVKNFQGVVTHFIGVQNDITGRKKAELSLLRHQEIMEKQIQERTRVIKESEEYLASIVATVRESLIVLDKNHEVISVNNHFLKTFKVSTNETQGKGLHELGNGQWNIPKLRQLLEDVLPTNNAVEDFEVEHNFPQIGKKVMLVNAHRVELEGNFKDRILIAIEDITEKREMEQRKDNFLSIASHELKTPLTTVKGYIQMMRRFTLNNPNDKLKGIVDKTSRHVDKLNGLITELLDVSRIQTGNLKLHKESFDFNKMIAEIVEGFQAAAETHHITVIGKAINRYVGDESHIVQVINNLIGNAIKYAPDSNKITVYLSLVSDYLKVSVTDYGMGISIENQKKIFDRFYRVAEIQQHFSGMGIGLYICNQIIKNHDGNLWVESELGKGSTFSFTLPLNETWNLE